MGKIINKFFKGNEEGKVTINEISNGFIKYSFCVAIAAVALMIVGLISYICFGSIIISFGDSIDFYDFLGVDDSDEDDIIKKSLLISIGVHFIILGWGFTWIILFVAKICTNVKDKWKSRKG